MNVYWKLLNIILLTSPNKFSLLVTRSAQLVKTVVQVSSVFCGSDRIYQDMKKKGNHDDVISLSQARTEAHVFNLKSENLSLRICQ